MRIDDLCVAFPTMPQATRDALAQTLSRLDQAEPAAQSTHPGSERLSLRARPARHTMRAVRLPMLALLALLLLAGVAGAAAYPQVVRWLVGPGETPSAELEALARPLDVAATTGDITVRLTGYVTDGQELALSFEMENADPAHPAFVVLSSVYMGETDIQRHVLSTAYENYRWVPLPFLDVLPVQRNPVTYGQKFWIGDVSAAEASGEAPVTATLHILRPTLPFVIVDELMHGGLSDYDEKARAEIQDVLDTLLSFEGTAVAQPGDMDPQAWFDRGYIPIDHHCELLTDVSILDFVAEEAALTLTFDVRASSAVAELSPDIRAQLGDCEAVLRRVSLSPMSTALVLDLIPPENTFEAAQALGERYGALTLCDGDGAPMQYLSMDWMTTDRGYAREDDGRWVCRYAFDMPGLAAFPGEIRLRLTGEAADAQALERFEAAMHLEVGLSEE